MTRHLSRAGAAGQMVRGPSATQQDVDRARTAVAGSGAAVGQHEPAGDAPRQPTPHLLLEDWAALLRVQTPAVHDEHAAASQSMLLFDEAIDRRMCLLAPQPVEVEVGLHRELAAAQAQPCSL